jgi:hypothetical protein
VIGARTAARMGTGTDLGRQRRVSGFDGSGIGAFAIFGRSRPPAVPARAAAPGPQRRNFWEEPE